jgi:hypothetical protein
MAERGIIAAELARRARWNPAKVSLLLDGTQEWRRRDVFCAAEVLGVEPHELFLTPKEAEQLRAIRAAISASTQ